MEGAAAASEDAWAPHSVPAWVPACQADSHADQVPAAHVRKGEVQAARPALRRLDIPLADPSDPVHAHEAHCDQMAADLACEVAYCGEMEVLAAVEACSVDTVQGHDA